MRYLSLLVLLFLASYASAQKNVIDKIIAVVGEEIVLKSDIENQFLHEQSQGLVNSSSDSRTRILENLLVQKLLVAQAKIDSIDGHRHGSGKCIEFPVGTIRATYRFTGTPGNLFR